MCACVKEGQRFDAYGIGVRVLQNAMGRPILSSMAQGDLPFQLLAAQAVDAVVADSNEPPVAALAVDGDLRSSVIAAVELVLIDLDRTVSPLERTAIATMIVRHLSTTGLLSPHDVMRFAVRNCAHVAEALRAQPSLMVGETNLSQLLPR